MGAMDTRCVVQVADAKAVVLGSGRSRHIHPYVCQKDWMWLSRKLNQLVNRLGDEEMKKEWWVLSFGPRTSKKDPEWKGIQNRRPPGPKKQRKKTSDQDVPQMSERDLWRAAMSGEYIDPTIH